MVSPSRSPSDRPRAAVSAISVVVVLGVLWLAVGADQRAAATPQYAARSGRACDNCHLSPDRWENPKLSERKCSLACQVCHVDPAGGGMRNAVGRFYGRSTVPAIATSPRPTADWDRNVPAFGRRDRATRYTDDLPRGPSTFVEAASFEDAERDRWAWGRPLGGRTRYGLLQGRYGSLNADPMLRVAFDIRLAALASGKLLRFPMQVDFPVAFHPVHHLTIFANTGARGRLSGYADTFDDSHTMYFRDAFVLLHEAPFQAYVKAGRFVPSYGLRLDDHTTRIRRQFELDGSVPDARVTGVEVGAAANYPFVNVSYFRSRALGVAPEAWNVLDVEGAGGIAANAGWRDEGWTVGLSAMVRRRTVIAGGDAASAAVYGAINAWEYDARVPVTYQFEVDYGVYDRRTGAKTDRLAYYQELDVVVFNGVGLLAAHDWVDPDRGIRDDASHRLQFGVQLTPVAGITVDVRVRGLVPEAGGSGSDIFAQTHLWW